MKCLRVLLLIVLSFVFAGCEPLNSEQKEIASSDVREKISLVEWQFSEDKTPEGSEVMISQPAEWTTVIIPHVFRLSGLPEESSGLYRRTITAKADETDRRFYLFLEGAGSVADVFVNSQHIGRHRGAFTAAAFDLTPAIMFGQDNELLLRVTNRESESANCLSKSNLFYTNGGLYRPAWLIKTNAVHIYPDMGSTGVYLTPVNISKEKAELQVHTVVRNSRDRAAYVRINYTVKGPNGKKCGQFYAQDAIPANSNKTVIAAKAIANPKLWDIGKPNLYTVEAELVVDGKAVDSLTERTGFRKVEMKDNRFVINGKELLARGVCKHHQSEYHWNAINDEELLEEWKGMVDLGCNTIRLAHYPHRRFEYHLADELGIAIWAENGLAGQKWDRGDNKHETKPNADGERITREMVRQNWNHPSIVFWSSGNETYQEVASHYADIIRKEDKTRLITYASAGEKPKNVDFVAGNTYQGWYYAHYTDFKKLPENAFISETGSGSWITHHVPYGTSRWNVDKFEPEEYNELFAEFRFQTVFRNNPSEHKMFLWWNFREFYNKKFKDNRNTKGILTLNSMPKDYYYLFKSFMNEDESVLHLCGRHHFYRRFEPNNGIKVYSNAKEVELFINGISQGKMKNGDYVQPDATKKSGDKTEKVEGIIINNVFFWKAALDPGKNIVSVRDDRFMTDSMTIYQKALEGPMPVSAASLVTNLESSNKNNPAIFIDRPVESQGPFYSEVDGSSDNTFDVLPKLVEGSSWISTKRLSDEKNKTDLSFTVTKPATVYVMYSIGTFPAHTLDKPDTSLMQTADAFADRLKQAGFTDTGVKTIWRRHSLWLADCGLLSRKVKPGDMIHVPGRALDYVVMIKRL